MFIELNHKKLDVYKSAGQVVIECYKITAGLPHDERFNITQQIRRCALSITLNIAEGASRSSAVERKRYYQVARGSLVEVDAAIGICVELKLLQEETCRELGELLNKTFAMLSAMIK